MMKKKYQLALHIFRRDLRLFDNSALIAALTSAQQVIPCFIFDKRQIEHNPYKSEAALQFMANSLQELSRELKQKKGKLYFFSGIAEKVVQSLIHTFPIDAVFLNRDYTPFSKKRDDKIEKLCRQKSIDYHSYADALLHEPEQIFKANGEPYTVFTPFFKKASQLTVASPKKNLYTNYYHANIDLEDSRQLKKLLSYVNSSIVVQGGRKEGLKLLKHLKTLDNYNYIRNFPAVNGTSKLSAHNKFGTVSIREVYSTIIKRWGEQHTLVTELYWRDFFTHIVFHFPHVLAGAFQTKYQGIKWENNKKYFQAWCQGETGFPIVDAGMRELNQTGYMHNRVRMIVASFLTKDLHIDWRSGEKYFAKKLVDYDPAINNGNWQWTASTGCDAQPYFRIFNPWLQQKKYDPACIYIKRFVPELAGCSPEEIHLLGKKFLLKLSYPRPIVDHNAASRQTKNLYTR